MTTDELEILDFRVTDLVSHVNPGIGTELQLSTKSSVSARTPDPFDGTLYLYLKTVISGQEEGLFLFDITTETILKLPEGTAEVTEEDAPACIAAAQKKTYLAIRDITEKMGINPLELG